jgi:hypothetical protein
MPASSFNDPAHWLKRAKEMRALADGISDSKAKERMIWIAEEYEQLAKQSESRRYSRISRG